MNKILLYCSKSLWFFKAFSVLFSIEFFFGNPIVWLHCYDVVYLLFIAFVMKLREELENRNILYQFTDEKIFDLLDA
jgi:hypothetical protein